MNRLVIGFAFSTVAAIALGATSLYLFDRLHDQELRAETERVSRQGAEARYQQLEERYRELAEEREELSSSAMTIASSSPAASPGAATPATESVPESNETRRPERRIPRRSELLDTPQGRAVMRLQMKVNSKETYGDLLEKLNLNAEQADAFLELMADQRQREQDARREIPDRAARAATRQTLRASAQSEVAQLLGAQKAQQFANYQATLNERAEVNSFAGRLDAANLPMNDDQKERFITAMAEEKAAVPEPEITDFRDPVARRARLEWQEGLMKRTLERASSIFSDEQVQVLRDVEELQLAMQRQAAERMTRSSGGPRSPGRAGR